MKKLHLLLFSLFSVVTASAWAQWQWIDKDGHKVFSDRAPPTEILEKNILKRPPGMAILKTVEPSSVVDPSSPTAPTTPGQPPAGGKPVGVEAELELKRKLAAEAEASKRKADEEKVTKAKVENCARAKQAKTSFDSGVRITRTNADGEREVMDDTARSAEVKRIQGIINSDCR